MVDFQNLIIYDNQEQNEKIAGKKIRAFWAWAKFYWFLTLSVPVSCQQNMTFDDKKMRIDQTKPTIED